MSYFYIFIAALFEVAWMFSLKLMKFNDLKLLKWSNLFKQDLGIATLTPFLGYIFFGIGNIYFFALALKKIPATSAFAIWTALSIVLLKFTEMIFFKEKIAFAEIFFILLIITGIIGLKLYSQNV